MKLTIFQSGEGDCLLLKGESGHLMLCDGGTRSTMREHVSGELALLTRPVDLVYVSHIDSDHIGGILQLLRDVVAWRVYDFHQSNSDSVREPENPRPPQINGILHNAFSDQIVADPGPLALAATREIENVLNAMVSPLFGTSKRELMQAADDMQSVATSIPDALEVSGLIAPGALDIPLNKPPGADGASRLLLAAGDGPAFDLGSMSFTVLGPTCSEISSLREGWQNWLKENREVTKKLRAKLKERIDEFAAGALHGTPFDLRDWNGIPDVDGVTIPNIASLTFMVTEGEKTLLLTGDGQQKFILEGLERTGLIEPEIGKLRVTVLKVAHHGSENNTDADFANRVTADHYVFCGNGRHDNPDLNVLNIIYQSRENDNDEFHFWFSTTSAAQVGRSHEGHFQEVETLAAALRDQSGGRLNLHFNEGASIELPV